MAGERTQRPHEARASTERANAAPGEGLYRGRNEQASVELRVETEGTGAVSADLYRLAPGDQQHWVASLRSAPGLELAEGAGAWQVIAEDDLGGHAMGRIAVTAPDGSTDRLHAGVLLDTPLNGLPARTEIEFEVERVSDAVRVLGIEMEVEEGVAPPAAVDFRGREVTLESCLSDAGFSVIPAGSESRVPANSAGWGMSELHTLMQDFAAASLTERAWELHLLLLDRADDERLLGVMFDETEVLPRQGAAVFAGAIRAIAGIDHDRKLIQTTVHELGHALNLAHRFERVVGRADSTSFMNYDWRYKGGDSRDEYWERFAFSFDPDELAFLRHAPRTALIPGGAPFHSVRYWNEGTGGYSPYVPETPLEGLKLSLRPPQGGRLFAFAQPVFLEVELTNLTEQPIELPPVLLDPKGGFLEVLLRKTHGTSTRSLADAEPFSPVLQRCFDIDPGSFDEVAHGESIRNNLNLTYGSSGFPFAEPGAYEVTALLAIFDPDNERELIVRSEPLPIRVAAPQSVDEDRDAMDLFRDDVGVYLALGGNRSLVGAREALDGVVERRRANTADPVVAAIVRAQALDAGRRYLRYQGEGRFRELDADREEAAGLLARLDDTALRAFDSETARSTRRLAVSYRGEAR